MLRPRQRRRPSGLLGDFSQVKRIGEGMTAGLVEVQGSIGMHAGNNMKGGLLSIAGNADDWLAREMRGGKVVVMGNAGNYVGGGYRGEKCGMRGGEIEVKGSVGAYLGEHLCGGSIRIGGECGRLSRSCQSGRHNLHRRQHLSAWRRDEQRNYNCKRRGQGSAQLPEDGNRADRWPGLPKVCRRPGRQWQRRAPGGRGVILINRDGNMREQLNYFEVL